jgi:hypothetical protein
MAENAKKGSGITDRILVGLLEGLDGKKTDRVTEARTWVSGKLEKRAANRGVKVDAVIQKVVEGKAKTKKAAAPKAAEKPNAKPAPKAETKATAKAEAKKAA